VCPFIVATEHTAMVRLLVRRGANVMITAAGETRRQNVITSSKYTNSTTYD